MTRYAEQTGVPAEKSRAEIERVLSRYGADAFAYAQQTTAEGAEARVQFRAHGRWVRFDLPLPHPDDEEFKRTPRRRTVRSPEERRRVYDQEIRRRWRALALAVKAKLEAVQTGITTFESEFLAHIVLPDGQTVGQYVQPQVEAAYTSGKMPKQLPWFGGEG